MTTLVRVENPFEPQKHVAEQIEAGVRISTVMRRIGYLKGRGAKAERSHAFVVAINDKPVLYENWGYRLKSTDIISVINWPAGGGGGGSNPLQIVMMAVVMVAAFYTGGAAAAAGWSAGATAAAQAGVMVAGMTLIALTTPTPSLGQNHTGRGASPTYNISAQGNLARLGEVQAVSYGQVTQYVDFAAVPYTEINGNEQYLYQLFQLTRGHTQIDRIYIEDTPIENYSGIQIQQVNPGEKVTLFPASVYTSQAINGLELHPTDDNHNVVGPVVVVPEGDTANAIAFDIHYPRGGFRMNDQGKYRSVTAAFTLQYATVDEAGNVNGPWTEHYLSEELNTETPQMRSYRYDVPPGRYAIRAWRTTEKGSRQTNLSIVLSQVRSYMPPQESYGNVTMLAMIIKASNQINQNISRRVKVTHTRKIPVWDIVNGWSAPQATRNGVWAFCDIMRDVEYGAGIPTSRLDMRELLRLANIADARGDKFDYVYDQVSQLWGAAALALRSLRSTPACVSSQFTAIRNEPRSLPVAMYSPDNIVAGSFSTKYQFNDGVSTPDYVVVEYTNPSTNKPETVECALPGSKKERPVTLKLPGVTDRDQAWREGMSVCAQNRDQRRIITFTTELAGLIPRYNDLVQVSHDLPAWGYSGTVEFYNASDSELVVTDPHTTEVIDVLKPWEMRTSEPCPINGTDTHQISFRRPEGSMNGPYNVTRGPAGERSLIISGPGRDSIYVSDGYGEELTGYHFGPAERKGLKAVVLTAVPDENNHVQLTLTNYAESVHTAETGGAVPPPGPESNLPGVDGAPIIDRVSIEETAESQVQNVVATPANGAVYYEFEISADGVQWMNQGLRADPYVRVNLPPGTWHARARAFGRAMGPWTTTTKTLDGNVLPIPNIEAAYATTDKVLSIELSYVFEAGMAHLVQYVEVYASLTDNFANATKFVEIPAPGNYYKFTVTKNAYEMFFWFRVHDTAGRTGEWYNNGVPVRGASSMNAGTILDTLTGQLTSEQFIPELAETIDEIPQIKLDIDAINIEVEQIPIIKQDLEDTKAELSSETQARVDGDTALATRIDTVESVANGMGALIQAEQQARIDGDTALGLRIDTVQAQSDDNAAAIRNEQQARIDGDEALATRIEQVEARSKESFDTEQAWNFDTGVEGWTSAAANPLVWNNTPPYYTTLKKYTATTTRFDYRPAQKIDPKLNNIVRMRVRIKSDFAADSINLWASPWGSTSTSTSAVAPVDKTNPGWQTLEFDISTIVAMQTTDGIGRLLFGRSNDGDLDVDYIAIGRYSVPFARSVFRDEVTARIDGDTAVGNRVTTLQSVVDGNTSAIQSEASTRADADAALSSRIDTVVAKADGNAAAIQAEALARADGDDALAQQTEKLRAEYNVQANGENLIRDPYWDMPDSYWSGSLATRFSKRTLPLNNQNDANGYPFVASLTASGGAANAFVGDLITKKDGPGFAGQPIAGGKTYTFSGTVALNNNDSVGVVQVRCQFFDNGGTQVADPILATADLSAQGVWPWSATFTAPNAAASFRFRYRFIYGPQGGEFKATNMGLLSTRMQLQTVSEAKNAADILSEASTRANADGALATRIDQLEAKTDPGFDTERAWNFDADTEGWIPYGTTPQSSMTWTNESPYFIRNAQLAGATGAGRADSGFLPIPERYDGKLNPIIRARVRFPNGSQGTVFPCFVAINNGASVGSQGINVPINKDSTDWQIVDFDLNKFPGNVPTANNISRILLGDTRATVNGVFDIDYVAVGRYSTPLSRAALRTEQQARIDGDGALASRVDTVQATADGADAKAQQSLTASSNIRGELDATASIKVQAAVGGQMYAAGMSINVTAGPGGGQTTVAFLADRFAILNLANGAFTSPFMIQNGQVLIRQALIGTAWITTANIADGNITAAKIGQAQIWDVHIANGNITTAKIADANITTAKIGVAQIDTLRIANGAVVVGKSQSMLINIGVSSGQDWSYQEQVLSFGGTCIAFVQGLVAWGNGSGINGDGKTYASWADGANSGRYFEKDTLSYTLEPDNIGGVRYKAEWEFNAQYISATYTPGVIFRHDFVLNRPTNGSRQANIRQAILSFQR